MSVKIARYTRKLRIKLGLSPPVSETSTAISFVPLLGQGSLTTRISTLERNLNRLFTGWNQHLPQVLASVSEARQMARQADLSQRDVSEIKRTLADLTILVGDVASRVERLEATARDATVEPK